MLMRSAKGQLVPDPARGNPLPAEGRGVDKNNYWLRRKVMGDIRHTNEKVSTDDDKL